MTTDTQQPDGYDLEVQRLQAVPDEQFRQEVQYAWGEFMRPYSLFKLVKAGCALGKMAGGLPYIPCNCLTEIRARAEARSYSAQWPGLLPLIANDTRLPDSPETITREQLPLFARYQRALDCFRETREFTRELTEEDLVWFKQQVGLE